ncbi:hypothetical protein OBBRIDRAFT_182826 [Obba rivulosa]|uniref:Fungal STAND N-terminal Goodbye domain-containing protein n=1 Tax=Obba rivulosa TaxID=1052685 RepID=A0A8E2ARZ1_9APHY|nr:hypothetical protein OBBRIDRAFT_182826 [Obba rivulosa]
MSITLTRPDRSAQDQLGQMCPTGPCPADLQSCTHIPLISANQSSTSLLPSSQAPIERPLDFQQLFSDALDEYKRQTGTSLDSHPLGDKLKSCNSVDDVVAILTDQSRSFEDFRKKAPLMTRLKPIVNVVISVSETLGEGVALAFSPAHAIFCGIGVLLTAAKEVSSSYDALGDLFDHTANFLVRSKKYTQILPSNSEMKMILAKTLAQVIVIFALATKQVKQGRFMKYGKKLLKEKDVEDALKKLDNLTTEEARMTTMQCLEVIYLLFDKMKLFMDGA